MLQTRPATGRPVGGMSPRGPVCVPVTRNSMIATSGLGAQERTSSSTTSGNAVV